MAQLQTTGDKKNVFSFAGDNEEEVSALAVMLSEAFQLDFYLGKLWPIQPDTTLSKKPLFGGFLYAPKEGVSQTTRNTIEQMFHNLTEKPT